MPPKQANPVTGQKSISSFFKPKPQAANVKRDREAEVLVLDSSDEDDDGAGRSAAPFKRVKTEHDEQGSELEPIASTSKLPPPPPPPAAATSAPSPSSRRIAQFAYTPFKSISADGPRALTAEQQKRREAFVKRLHLGPGGRDLLKKRTSYLEKEHYLASGADGEDGGAGGAPGSHQYGEEDEEDGSEGSNDAGGKGKGKENTFAKFAAKGASAGGKKDVKGKGKAKEKDDAGGKVKYTPLEQQVLALKKAHPGVLLVVEVGYKFRFFGEDAQHASRALNIACFPSQHMLTASIPTHRLDIHVRRLLNAGYKVGVVRQQETAALKKASDNRSAPFTRALSALYTSATYVDELGVDPLGTSGGGAGGTAALMCIVEEKLGKQPDAKVRIGLVAVMPSTGEVVYDEFEDGLMRAELETRMLHLQPSELLLQKELSSKTESMVKHLVGQHNAGTGDFTTRIERIAKRPNATAATSTIQAFYAEARKEEIKKGLRKEPSEIVLEDSDEGGEAAADDEGEAEKGKKANFESQQPPGVLDLPKLVLIALASLVKHLASFRLDGVFTHTSSFSPFASRASMTLNGNTVANLELLRNSTDFREAGSLISVIDRCKTAGGKRLLRKWVKAPLLSVQAVNDRLTAISEIHSASSSLTLSKLRDLLKSLPDLERGLSRIHFGRASPNELLRVLEAFQRVGRVFDEVDSPDEADEAMGDGDEDGPVRRGAGGSLKSSLLKGIVRQLPQVRGRVSELLAQLDVKAARDNKKETLFTDERKYPELQACKEELADTELAMQDELKAARKVLRKPALQFTKVSQEEYLLEVKIAEAKSIVPADWIRINGTKQVYRYRTPKLQKKLDKLEQAKEKVAAAASASFLAFLDEVSTHYELFRSVIAAVSTADCLFSLALVALSQNWTRPTIVDESGTLDIVGGRHPIIEAVSSNAFVPNDVSFGAKGGRRSMILTGLNMGGKSSLSRSIALVALLAQIGSYVPAESCTSSLFDGIYTRMGANDDVARGRSTFMVELAETSEILRLATSRSLIILDELGRGTSTNDGQAIAEAVLEHIVREKKSLCVFVTHYPSLASLAKRYPECVTVNHMSCLETERDDGSWDVTFLYKLAAGLASSSHGLNVARLADLPESVIETARKKSGELAKVTEERVKARRTGRLAEVLKRAKEFAEETEGRGGVPDGESGAKLLEMCEALLA
ncbi:hypothetical protein JCM10213_006401 [Rhodosporidiobolus nylandii]